MKRAVKEVKLTRLLAWLDALLTPGRFDDVSNNGLQIAREGESVSRVAFAVDGSVAALKAAASAGAQLLVVHHGISWGGGIRRLTGVDYALAKAALQANLALYGMHLPLDANERCGNNWEIARFLNLTQVKPAFSYHGNVIGVIGKASRSGEVTLGTQTFRLKKGECVGVCSGGAADFAVEAKALGCSVFVTGEGSWADVIAAQNAGANLVCCGHYETETFGVKALAAAMRKELGVDTVFVDSRLQGWNG